jgi:hypothetical protein
MPNEFVMRGKTASGKQEVLNFSGHKGSYAFRMVDFRIYPSTSIGSVSYELAATVTAAKTYEDPENPDFTNPGLIATAFLTNNDNTHLASAVLNSVVNDSFLITQDLIIAAIDTLAGSPIDVNWQCKFVKEKLTGPEEAVANYKQFTISDGS